MAPSIDINSVIGRQAERAGPIERAISNLKRVGEANITLRRVRGRLDALRENWKDFKDNQNQIVDYRATSADKVTRQAIGSHDYFTGSVYEEVKQLYLDAQEYMESRIDAIHAEDPMSGNAMAERSMVQEGTQYQAPHLKPIELPKFNGEPRDWMNFRDLFQSLVGLNPQLTNVTKLHHLKTSVTGVAATRIESIGLTGDNFAIACDYLASIYDDKRLLVNTAMRDLIEARPVTKLSGDDLARYTSEVSRAITMLESLGQSSAQCDAYIVYIVTSKLDPDTVKEWEESLGTAQALPTWVKLLKFLESRARALRAWKLAKGGGQPAVKAEQSARTHHAAVDAAKTSSSSGPKKKQQAKSNQKASQSTSLQAGGSMSISAAISNHAISRTGLYREILLTTASVRVEAPGTVAVLAKALIDTGSELSFISEALTQLLKLPRRRVDVPLSGIGGNSSESSRGAVSFTFRPHFPSRYRCQVDAVTLPKLTADISSRHVATCDWNHLRGLQLTDPDYANTGRIDIILGADIYGQLLKSGVKRRPIEGPVAQSTELGWILSGPCTPIRHMQLPFDRPRAVPAQGVHCVVDRTSNDNELHELVHRFWCQEETASTTLTSLSKEEEECEAHFLSTHSRDSTGQYTVRLPFRSSPDALGDSHVCAKRMLSRLQKRFTSEPSLQQLYCEFLGQYETLGHMRLNPHARLESSTTFYLPHHGVLKESSTTTKLRVVFNGSAQSSSGKSINDLLDVGAKLKTNLSDVILRWRRTQFVFCADIEKMFRQINVHPEDWKDQRVLWSTDASADPSTYDLTTVTYGLGPAPFLAIRVLQQLVQDEGHRFPLAVNILTHGTYVDDTFGGADTLVEAQQTVQHLDGICTVGGFTLQKWMSNHADVLAEIPPDRRETSATILLEEDSLVKTLGIAWRPATDSFEFSAFNATQHTHFTKRKVLSMIAQLFDPRGWLSPVTIRAKIIM